MLCYFYSTRDVENSWRHMMKSPATAVQRGILSICDARLARTHAFLSFLVWRAARSWREGKTTVVRRCHTLLRYVVAEDAGVSYKRTLIKATSSNKLEH